jgi:hypothetical protein
LTNPCRHDVSQAHASLQEHGSTHALLVRLQCCPASVPQVLPPGVQVLGHRDTHAIGFHVHQPALQDTLVERWR